jgi:hypothetical protein
MSRQEWRQLGAHRPEDLVEERLQLHWAAQPLSAAAQAGIEHQPGDLHTNLGWEADSQALVTHAFPGGATAALDLVDFALHWRGADGATLASFELEGQTLGAAMGWMAEQLRPTVAALPEGPLSPREYEMPAHPVADGQLFSGGDRGRREELAHWYGNAAIALGETVRGNPASSDARVWPHHFDFGLLINYEPEKDPEVARSIGVGMSPGDASGITHPYYYVNPYPRPEVGELPGLVSGGYWEREAFVGALLTGATLIDLGENAEQSDRVRAFLSGAVEGCKRLRNRGN